jgi:uncharacterized protein (TIGR03067 family)
MGSPTTDDPSPMKGLSLEDSRLGTRLGDYLLTGVLGRGGMGVVYLARDIHLDRLVAVKLLPDHLTQDPERLRRFQKEARALAAVEHPHVLRIYHVGQAGPLYFVVMEWLRGGSVQQLIDERGALPWPDATRILIDACLGLEAVHTAGLVHRDIKPGNLLRDAHGHVKIADFGLVRYSSAEHGSITAPGQLTGTPEYMSPEQCRREETNVRTDIYSLGATYFKLLTGRVPYSDADLLKVMFAHCSAPVPDPRSLAPDLPEGCSAIVQRAMAKETAERYATAEALRAGLETLLTGSSLAAVLRSDLGGLAGKPPSVRNLAMPTVTLADPATHTRPADDAPTETRTSPPKKRSRIWMILLIVALVLLPLLCVAAPIVGMAFFWIGPRGGQPVAQKAPVSVDLPKLMQQKGQDQSDPASKKDREALVGTWVLVSAQPDGPLRNMKWIITVDKVIVSTTVDKSVEKQEGTYLLDATKNPKTIDLLTVVRETKGDFKTGNSEERTIVQTLKGIYSLNGDDLTVCVSIRSPGTDRPTDFVAKPGIFAVMTFKRDKSVPPGDKSDPASKKDRDALIGTWIAESVQPDLGHPLPNTKWNFTADKFITSKTVDKFLHQSEKTYSLDATKYPKTIDLMTETEDRTIETARGIYALNGDTLTVCLNISRPPGDRPAEFVAIPGVQIMVTLKREKPAPPEPKEKKGGQVAPPVDAQPGLIQTLDATGPITALAFHPKDSAQLCWGTYNGKCRIYKGQIISLPRVAGPLDSEHVQSIVYAGFGERIFVLFELGGAYRFWFHQPDEPPMPLLLTGKYQAVAASPNSAVAVLASTVKSEGKLSFNWDDGKDHGLADTPLGRFNHPVHALAWPADDLLVTGGDDGEVIIWDAKKGTQKQIPKLNFLPLQTIKSVDLTLDGLYVLASDGKRFLVNRGDEFKFGHDSPRGIAAVALSPLEPLVAWSVTNTLFLQHINWLHPISIPHEDPAKGGDILSLAFSRDGNHLVTGTSGGKVRIWDVSKIIAR